MWIVLPRPQVMRCTIQIVYECYIFRLCGQRLKREGKEGKGEEKGRKRREKSKEVEKGNPQKQIHRTLNEWRGIHIPPQLDHCEAPAKGCRAGHCKRGAREDERFEKCIIFTSRHTVDLV